MTFRTVLDGIHMPECPRWHDGELWLSDIWGRRVLRADGTTVREYPDDVAGLGWLPDGRLLAVGMLERVVFADGDVHADLSVLNPHMLNDMIVTTDGTAFVSGFGWKMWEGGTAAPSPILRVRPDGSAAAASESLMAPNGMALTPDERTLIVAEPGAGGISRFTITDGGDLVDRRVFALEKAAGAAWVTPDGICLDAEDHVWAADPMGRRVIRIAPDGSIVEVLPIDDGFPLAVCLGGDDRRTLFICVGAVTHKHEKPEDPMGKLVATDVAVPGAGKP